MSKWLNSMQPWGALLLRLALGFSMAVHGYQKVVPHGALHHSVHYIVSMGFPLWLAYTSVFTELVGGVFLILGLLTRLAAAMVATNMLVAFFIVGVYQGFGIYNYILILAASAIMLVFYGAGALATDRKFNLS
jgi:putative oxidoreductase